MLKEKIEQIEVQAFQKIAQAATADQLYAVKVEFLGRKSEFTNLLKGLKDLDEAQRREVGSLANEAKLAIQDALEERAKELEMQNFDLASEKLDVTLPALKKRRGHLHPLTKIQNEIEDIFTALGFATVEGPEVEWEYYNFDTLNIPKDHPARDKWDTFWIKQQSKAKDQKLGRMLLRTHTSPVQVRYMETHQPPLRVVAPGKCFRNEATDATHEHSFYQFEALMVDEKINVGNFKFVAEQFFSRFFKRDVKVRIRPSFFPFTEPSFEFDISCTVCGGNGCPACKGGGWLEVGGAGMVNQNVFVAAGYPRGKYQGFAWGFGLERLLMMRDKVNDIRLFHSGDLRFINQF